MQSRIWNISTLVSRTFKSNIFLCKNTMHLQYLVILIHHYVGPFIKSFGTRYLMQQFWMKYLPIYQHISSKLGIRICMIGMCWQALLISFYEPRWAIRITVSDCQIRAQRQPHHNIMNLCKPSRFTFILSILFHSRRVGTNWNDVKRKYVKFCSS